MSITSETDARSAATVVLESIETEGLWGAVGQLIGDQDLESLTPDELVDLGLAVPPLLPADVRRRIIEFRRRAPHGDVLLLRGLVPDHVNFASTPAESSLPVSGSAQRVQLLVVGIMTLLGEPFTYETLWSGRLVANLVPVPTKEYTQTSQGSAGLFDWHVEDGYREDRCDHLGLICLRPDPLAASKYAQARDLQLAPELAATLRERRFQLRPDPAHVLPDDMPKRRIAVLTGPDSAPEIVYDTYQIEVLDEGDEEASAALRELHQRLDDVQIEHVMAPGDLLVLDNKRVVHARTPFEARFDGTDRWMMRVMVCGSVVTFRRWGRRITH